MTNPIIKALVSGGAALLLVVGAALVSGPSAVAGAAQASPNVPVFGVVELTDDDGYAGDATHCSGLTGFTDLRVGTDLTIYGANGDLLASTRVSLATIGANGSCYMIWDVPGGVLRSAGPFQYEISHRGRLSFTAEDALSGALVSSIGGHN